MLLAAFCYSQQPDLSTVDSLVSVGDYSQSELLLQEIDTTKLSRTELAQFHFLFGQIQINVNSSDESLDQFLKAKRIYSSLDSLNNVAIINLKIAESLNALNNPDLDPQPYINEYLEYAEDNGDPALLSKAYMQLGKIYINSDPDKTIKFFNNALDQNSRINDSLMDAKIHHNLGVVYGEILKQKDSALYHYDIALKQYQKENLEDYISYIFNNKASLYRNLGDYDAAIAWYQKLIAWRCDSMNWVPASFYIKIWPRPMSSIRITKMRFAIANWKTAIGTALTRQNRIRPCWMSILNTR